jgi:hypothetical protein
MKISQLGCEAALTGRLLPRFVSNEFSASDLTVEAVRYYDTTPLTFDSRSNDYSAYPAQHTKQNHVLQQITR